MRRELETLIRADCCHRTRGVHVESERARVHVAATSLGVGRVEPYGTSSRGCQLLTHSLTDLLAACGPPHKDAPANPSNIIGLQSPPPIFTCPVRSTSRRLYSSSVTSAAQSVRRSVRARGSEPEAQTEGEVRSNGTSESRRKKVTPLRALGMPHARSWSAYTRAELSWLAYGQPGGARARARLGVQGPWRHAHAMSRAAAMESASVSESVR